MKLFLDISEQGTSKILYDTYHKFILSLPRKQVRGVAYTIRQLFPDNRYLTGLFKTKNKNTYSGRTSSGVKVYLTLEQSRAVITFK